MGSLNGKGTILLVERDTELREWIGRILANEGYHVFMAADGHQAFRLSEMLELPVHILMTDAALTAELNGVDLARHLLVMRRGLQVLYLSCLPEDAIVRRQMQGAFDTFLSKPVDIGPLLDKVRALMRKARAGSAREAAFPMRESGPDRMARVTRLFPTGAPNRIFPHRQVCADAWRPDPNR